MANHGLWFVAHRAHRFPSLPSIGACGALKKQQRPVGYQVSIVPAARRFRGRGSSHVFPGPRRETAMAELGNQCRLAESRRAESVSRDCATARLLWPCIELDGFLYRFGGCSCVDRPPSVGSDWPEPIGTAKPRRKTATLICSLLQAPRRAEMEGHVFHPKSNQTPVRV